MGLAQQCDSPHVNTVTWTITSGLQNDVEYRIDIDYSTESTPVHYSSVVTGLSTYDTSYDHVEWGIVGQAGSGTFWTYKVKIVRKSAGTVMSSQITNTLNTGSHACLH